MQAEIGDQREVIWVVHGRNEKIRAGMFSFLRAIGLKPREWNQAVDETVKDTSRGTPHVGEILETAFSKNRAVVVVMTPDDEARLRESFRKTSDPTYESQLTGQARPNVIFEAGMALGKCEDRTILVEVGTLRPISNLAGRYVIRWDGSIEKRKELAGRLEAAGCPVDTSGTDWLTQPYFDVESEPSIPPSSTDEEASRRQPPPTPEMLPEKQHTILLKISQEDESVTEWFLSTNLNMSMSEVKYHLTELQGLGLARMISFNTLTGDRTWGLTQEGRAYIFGGQT
jgi:predicted nucleotide-binding protein